jgi:hypothetical protein
MSQRQCLEEVMEEMKHMFGQKCLLYVVVDRWCAKFIQDNVRSSCPKSLQTNVIVEDVEAKRHVHDMVEAFICFHGLVLVS